MYICDWKLRGISFTVYVTQTISDFIRGSGRSFLPVRYCRGRYLLDQRNMLPPETRKIWRRFDWWVFLFSNELLIPAFITASAFRIREGKDPDIDLARVPTRYCVLGRALPPYTKVFLRDVWLWLTPFSVLIWQCLNTTDRFIKQVL